MRIRLKVRNEIYSHDVRSEQVSIGRSRDNDFVIPLEDFSRRHCILTWKSGYLFIMDLGSKNGVSVDGRKLAPNEQEPIYESSSVFIANHFELILHEGTIKDEGQRIILDDVPNKKR